MVRCFTEFDRAVVAQSEVHTWHLATTRSTTTDQLSLSKREWPQIYTWNLFHCKFKLLTLVFCHQRKAFWRWGVMGYESGGVALFLWCITMCDTVLYLHFFYFLVLMIPVADLVGECCCHGRSFSLFVNFLNGPDLPRAWYCTPYWHNRWYYWTPPLALVEQLSCLCIKPATPRVVCLPCRDFSQNRLREPLILSPLAGASMELLFANSIPDVKLMIGQISLLFQSSKKLTFLGRPRAP